ncbi:MAG: YgaP-like transmembrane domain [Verrucomicrobiota bacterium]|nr:DUF2892 domain-containing protein [Limisphaerales bacterium]
MKKFFLPNLETRGRLVRGAGGSVLVAGGVAFCGVNLLAAVILIVSGGFMLFEAVRGWCVMRACGIKTKL